MNEDNEARLGASVHMIEKALKEIRKRSKEIDDRLERIALRPKAT